MSDGLDPTFVTPPVLPLGIMVVGDAVELELAAVGEAAEPDEDGGEFVAAAAMKGLLSEEREALVRSSCTWRWLDPECWVISAEVDVLSSASPMFQAAMKGEVAEVEEVRRVHVVPMSDQYIFCHEICSHPPCDQRDLHFTFATIFPPTIPLPANSVSPLCNPLSFCGSNSPSPFLPLNVTLPFPFAYMTKMVAPAICRPMPSATHWYDVGAEIWKYRGPVEDEEMLDPEGMPTL